MKSKNQENIFEDLTDAEKSLLLYLEDRIVNNSCQVDSKHMNFDDFDIAKKWNDSNFLIFKRLPGKYILDNSHNTNSHYVKFNEQSWDFAQRLRKERGSRQEKRLIDLLETFKR
jgi:hypothetical protein